MQVNAQQVTWPAAYISSPCSVRTTSVGNMKLQKLAGQTSVYGTPASDGTCLSTTAYYRRRPLCDCHTHVGLAYRDALLYEYVERSPTNLFMIFDVTEYNTVGLCSIFYTVFN